MLGAISLLGIGSSFAAQKKEVSIQNTLQADNTATKIVEVFTPQAPVGTVSKDVKFKNSGSSDVFMRIAYVESWKQKNEAGEVQLLENQIGGIESAQKQWTDAFQSQWQDGGDGWFYYRHILSPGQETDSILKQVMFSEESKAIKAAEYSLYFRVEVLQASRGADTLNSEQVNADAANTVFGKTVQVSADENTVNWR